MGDLNWYQIEYCIGCKMSEEPNLNVESKEESKKSASKKPKPNPWFQWTRDIVICLIVVLFFRGYVAEANYIPSPSMEPTLKVDDRIIVDKLSKYWRPLERGDMVVFHPPLTAHESERWIKRVVGLPGDTVQVINGIVYIDGRRLEEPYIKATPHYSYGPIELVKDDPGTEVDEAQYFLLGDNRDNSMDSHVWHYCTADRIIGRAIFRYWPLNKIGNIAKTGESHTAGVE
jgi:signal peptidase I